jgi:hypothetical protein
MKIEVHQRGGVLGMDRRYVIADGRIEVIDKGHSRGAKDLEPSQAARIDALAADAAGTTPLPAPSPTGISDDMVTAIAIENDAGATRRMKLQTGDDAPDAVWNLIGEVSRASGL